MEVPREEHSRGPGGCWPGPGVCGGQERGQALTAGVGGSSDSGALAPFVPLLSSQGPDWAGGSAPRDGSGLGVWALGGLGKPCRSGGFGASRPRPRSERSRGLSGTWSLVAVASCPLGLPGPVGCVCPPPEGAAPAASPWGPSESELTGGEGGVPPGVGGPLSQALTLRPWARSCWERSRCSAPSSRGSRTSTRAPGSPSRPADSSQASTSPAFRPWGRGPRGTVGGAWGLQGGL